MSGGSQLSPVSWDPRRRDFWQRLLWSLGWFCLGTSSPSPSLQRLFFSGVLLSHRTSAMPLRCEVDSLESLALSRVEDVVTKVEKLLCICRGLWIILSFVYFYVFKVDHYSTLGSLWIIASRWQRLLLSGLEPILASAWVARLPLRWRLLKMKTLPQVLGCADRLGRLLLSSTPSIFHNQIATATLGALSSLICKKSSKAQSRWVS